jgi:hypothetical protein
VILGLICQLAAAQETIATQAARIAALEGAGSGYGVMPSRSVPSQRDARFGAISAA